jgi:3-deoxy-D-manno-octulosonic-acid transferase
MRKNLKKELGFSGNSFVVLGCSTWPGEEAMLLEAFRKIGQGGHASEGYNLLLVPRHGERRGKLVRWLRGENVSFWQRSKGIAPGKFDVCLADTTGELAQLVQVADLAYIGKSLAPNAGGQSPLDAAMAGVPAIYGNRMTNFRDICAQLELENAAIRVENGKDAIDTIAELVTDGERLQILSNNIGNWFRKNQGASLRVSDFIRERV